MQMKMVEELGDPSKGFLPSAIFREETRQNNQRSRPRQKESTLKI